MTTDTKINPDPAAIKADLEQRLAKAEAALEARTDEIIDDLNQRLAKAEAVNQRLAKAEAALELVFRLAAFFQDDYSTKLPVIAAFRRWRGGQLSTEAFLKRLGEDDLADVLRYEGVPPMEGLALLNARRR
jgi:hypothetical protein